MWYISRTYMKEVGYSRWSIVYTSWKRENTSGFLMFLMGKNGTWVWNELNSMRIFAHYIVLRITLGSLISVPSPLLFFQKIFQHPSGIQESVPLVQITSKLQNNICDQGNDLCISTFCAFLITSTNSHSKILDSWVCALKILAENEL